MLAEQDFSQMQEYILKVLPQLLRQNPEISTTIEGMLAHQFPRRDEFIQLLNEVKLLREDTDRRFEFFQQEMKQLRDDMNRRFEENDKRFELFQQEMKQLRDDMNRRFEKSDKRFELFQQEMKQLRDDMNRRFEESDKRFQEEMKQLRDDMNRRFEENDKRFELEMKQLREETNRRFEERNKRFELEMKQLREDMNRLREDMNRRFEESDKRFELFQQEMKQLREDMDRRFEEEKRERLDIKRRLIKVETTVTRLDEKITQFDAWLNVVTGNIGDKRGQEAEQFFALGLSYGLKRSDIKPETIQLRQIFMDEEGFVFPKKGRSIEVDIIAEDGKLEVFEIKITAVETDVAIFARKIQLIQKQMPDKPVSGIFISPNASEEVKQCCAEYDLMFVG